MPQDAQTGGRLIATPEGVERGRRLFAHAKRAEETRNYDYAVELYVQGLEYWPDAIEEGLKKLRVVATARKNAGGKPASFMMKRKLAPSGKNAAADLNRALHVFALDPTDLASMEQVLELSQKAKCDRVAQWMCPIVTDTLNRTKKLSSSHYLAQCNRMLDLGRMAREFRNYEGALEIFRANVAAAQIWRRHHPDSSDAHRAESDASGELAIVKGRFDSAADFTESLEGRERQQEIQDSDRTTHTVDRHQQLVDSALRDWEQNRNVPNKLLKVVDLLTRTEDEVREKEAVKLLEDEYAASSNYVFRRKADDIRMRRAARGRRMMLGELKRAPDDDELRERLAAHDRRQIELELRIFTERLKHYPTDLGLKYELGLRLFRLGRYDEAIPLFQQARADGRVRLESRLFLGRCFFQKHFYDQAVDVLRQGAEESPSRSAPVYLELTYWLARAFESTGARDDARKAYGEIIQTEYNFRDARLRLEKLVDTD